MQTSQPGFGRLGARAIQRPLALALSLGLGVAPLAGMAATIIVTSSGDVGSAGTCTLRQAIVSMNTGSVAGSGCVNSAVENRVRVHFHKKCTPTWAEVIKSLLIASGLPLIYRTPQSEDNPRTEVFDGKASEVYAGVQA